MVGSSTSIQFRKVAALVSYTGVVTVAHVDRSVKYADAAHG
jgi:hypothetical protein